MRLMVTGGAGFIGSAVVRASVTESGHDVVNVDKLTYAGNLDSVAGLETTGRYRFERADICDPDTVRQIFRRHRPDAVIHLAAETHVDRSIDGPGEFVRTNVVGSYTLLSAATDYWRRLDPERQLSFRFVHVSTDEVFGSLGNEGYFTEDTPYRPNSPYAASKAGADHLVRSWHHTYGLPTVVTNCSNNFGPYQFPEKLVPLMILNALEGRELPVYGTGSNVRDWLYVDDHADALLTVLAHGRPGESYAVSGGNERANAEVVRAIADLVDEMVGPLPAGPRRSLIRFVQDRPGHDFRYAIDGRKVRDELGWRPRETFETGLRRTVRWYLDNRWWWERVRSGAYRGERLGLGVPT